MAHNHRVTETMYDEDKYSADTLALWWDLGPRTSPARLEEAQKCIADFMDAAGYLLAVRKLDEHRGARQHLWRDGDRVYLNKRRERRLEDLRPRTTVAASGYSNPWWQLLQDASAVVAGTTATASSVLVLAMTTMKVVKKARLFSADVSASRNKLLVEAAKDELTLQTIREARLVVPPRSRLRELDDETRQLLAEAYGPALVDADRDDAVDPRRRTRPSASADVPAHEALVALAADDFFEKALKVKLAIESGGGDFEAELIDAVDAAKRLPVVVQLQRQVSEFALGGSDAQELRWDLLALAHDLGGPSLPEDVSIRTALPSGPEAGPEQIDR